MELYRIEWMVRPLMGGEQAASSLLDIDPYITSESTFLSVRYRSIVIP